MTKTIVENPKSTIQLISFDIFDTLVTRRVATPVGIFALMQEFIKKETNLPDFIKNNFYSIRINSEKLARMSASQLYKTPEISFDDIYSVMQNNCYLTDEEVKFLKELEISTEIKNLVPIDKNISLLKEYINAGKKVVLISDMYHSSETIHKLLSHIDPIFNNIKVYISSEYKVSKGQGSLFGIVKDNENIECKKWLHIGDNPNADIKQASKYGIKVKHFKLPKLMSYETKFNGADACTQCVIGAARLARFKEIGQRQDKFNFGASFAAPLLYSYVDYIIEQSLARGFKELYFIARDGYIPKIIADIIIEKRGLDIKTKYIYGSRLAWRLITEENFDDLINIFFNEYRNIATIELVAYRLGYKPEELSTILALNTNKNKLNNNDLNNIKNKIINNPKIRQQIIAHCKPKVNLLKEYFKQEVNLNNEEIVFVDLQGSGKTQKILGDILNSITPAKLYFFYLFCNTTNMLLDINHSISSYLPNFAYSCWIELLSKTYDGQTEGYDIVNNKVKPITENVNIQVLKEWGLDEYILGIKIFTLEVLNSEKINNINTNSLILINRYINFVKVLDKQTADILGSIPHKNIGYEYSTTCSAPKISFRKTFKNFLLCRKEQIIFELPFISLARSDKFRKKWLKFIQKYPTIQKFLFNIYIHKRDKEAYIRILGIKISFGGLLWKGKRNVN